MVKGRLFGNGAAGEGDAKRPARHNAVLPFPSLPLASDVARRLRVGYFVAMNGRRELRYDFLQVTDETLDVRAPALARLLSATGRKVTRAEAVLMLVELDRYVVRRVEDEADDLMEAFRAAAFLPTGRAEAILSAACRWPLAKASKLVAALADPEVRAMEAAPNGWLVRAIPERYGRFANQKRMSRERTRNNDRARAAGWEPGEGKTWVHTHTGEVKGSLREVIAGLEGQP